VIGVGNPYRRDDGIGPAVAAGIGGLHLPGVRVTLSDGDPAGLLDAWTGVPLAVVADAVLCEPSAPGRIWRSVAGSLPGDGAAASSHGLGVPDALRLGQVLDRLPGRLVVITVEAASLGLGVTGAWNVAAVQRHVHGSYETTLVVKLAVVAVSGITAALHARARSAAGLAVFGTLTGVSAIAALFLGILLAG
jgi:hydrogenase maturation protease